MTRIYRSEAQDTIEKGGKWFTVTPLNFDEMFRSEDPAAWLDAAILDAKACEAPDLEAAPLLAPIGSQEIWAAGVTYFRSREARMEEAESAGGDVFYDKVYDAERPELFMKATASRARGNQQPVGIRSDSSWDVPEPELTLAINSAGKIFGYTIGNDMSSRSIEGENPLYLPQAKVYTGSCALGPALVVGPPLPSSTAIRIDIQRGEETMFSGETDIGQIKRGLDELADFLFRCNEFPDGALLMTGTGIVPGSDFTLAAGDVVRISIDPIGTLENTVEVV
jgi:2-dehydro-3-deoxy-D-arabinonate dehydratase